MEGHPSYATWRDVWWPWVGPVARLVVGGVWIAAGALKVGDLDASVRAVRNFDVLPESVVSLTGHLLPFLEILIGALLVVGLATRFSATLSGLLQVAFIIGIAQAWARGLKLDCGCFGGGGAVEGDPTRGYVLDLLRDAGLLGLSVLLVLWPRTKLAIDSWIWMPREYVDGDEAQP